MKKILVIDPAKTFIKYVDLIVKRYGYKVVPAGTAAEAMGYLERGDIAMIITAHQLPDAPFRRFCEVFRQQVNAAGIPVLVLAPEEDPDLAEKCREFDFARIRTKPIAMPDLLEVLQETLPITRTRRKVRAPVRIKALLREVGELRSYMAFNLSEGGVFLVRDNPPPVGATVEILLPLPGLPTPLKMAGRVVSRVEQPVEGSPPGFGVEFIDMNDESRALLGQYMKDHISDLIP